jgi:hypothetical protein
MARFLTVISVMAAVEETAVVPIADIAVKAAADLPYVSAM